MKKFFIICLPVLYLTAVLLGGCSGSNATGVPINVVSREDGSGTRSAFTELFGILVTEGGNKTDRTTKEANIVSKTDVMLTSVAGDKNAIGYVSLGSLNDSVKALDIDGVKATAENVKNGTYAIKRPFNIATKGEVSDLTADFIGYILSAEGQQVVAKECIPIIDNASPYTGSKPQGKLVIAGSSSVSPLMEKLAEAYKNINPNASVEIQASDSGAGIKAAADGTCDIGMASRALKDSEKEALTEIAIAIDGIAVIVNKDNTRSGLTTVQVRMIYTGEVTQWSEVE